MLARKALNVAALLAGAALASPALGQTVYSTDFTDLSGWTVTGPGGAYEWNVDATPLAGSCSAAPFISAPACLNFNDGSTFGSPTGGTFGSVTSPPIGLDPSVPAARLTFWYSIDHEISCTFDWTTVEILDDLTGQLLAQRCLPSPVEPYDCGWRQAKVHLDPAWGLIRIRFQAGSVDQYQNTGRGPFIDDLVVEYECGTDAEYVCRGLDSSAYPWVLGTFGGSRLEADGSPSISAGLLAVRATRIEGPGFAMLLAGAGPREFTTIGNGQLCIPLQTVQRVALAAVDPMTDSVDWSVPIGAAGSPLAMVMPGDSLIVQAWYRDVTAGNFSDALRIHFCQ